MQFSRSPRPPPRPSRKAFRKHPTLPAMTPSDETRSRLNFEVQTFNIYGTLRKVETQVRNCGPSASVINIEKTLLAFEEKRRVSPDDVNYRDFYDYISGELIRWRCPGPVMT
ncbi:unnamed protein product [Lymnaea stagnalis]|uniref:Uncharacterized protein n=1 Tax=Lymnaea stagnalis TaxID=6523 RepID=A0AAV2HFG7_LYMST